MMMQVMNESGAKTRGRRATSLAEHSVFTREALLTSSDGNPAMNDFMGLLRKYILDPLAVTIKRIDTIIGNVSKASLNAIEAATFRTLVLGAGITIVAFALAYFVATKFHCGIKDGDKPIGFFDCIYFSMVTITTLGYGDVSPVGFGRILACVEVVIGLTGFGVGVAKLSSYKQSYLLNQLYARDLQQRLDLFTDDLREQRSLLKTAINEIKLSQSLTIGAMRLLEQLRKEVLKVRAVVSFESRNGYLVSGTPIGSIVKLLEALTSLVSTLHTMVTLKGGRKSQKHRIAAKDIIMRSTEICGYFSSASDGHILREVQALSAKCESAISSIDGMCARVDAEFKDRSEEQRRRFKHEENQE